MSTALGQWRLELVQSKCIMGCYGGLYKSLVARRIVILGRHLFDLGHLLSFFYFYLFIFFVFLEIYFLSITFF